jgi:hypothetical protein
MEQRRRKLGMRQPAIARRVCAPEKAFPLGRLTVSTCIGIGVRLQDAEHPSVLFQAQGPVAVCVVAREHGVHIAVFPLNGRRATRGARGS